MPEPLTATEAADLAGIPLASFRRYIVRGSAPKPDGHFSRSPWWHRETIEQWIATRPRRGRPLSSEVPRQPCGLCSWFPACERARHCLRGVDSMPA